MAKFAAKDSNKNITLSPHGTGKVVVGTGAADATVQSDGNHNLVLQTGNSTTGSITLTDGADGDIAISPNGTGTVVVNTDLDVDNININSNAITSTNTNGDIELSPNGSGEIKVGSGSVSGKISVNGSQTLEVKGASGSANLQLENSGALRINATDILPVITGTGAGHDFSVNTTMLVVSGDTGYIGVGNNTPVIKLHISGTDGQSAALMIEDTNSSTDQKRFRIYSNNQKVYFDNPRDDLSTADDLMHFDLSNQKATFHADVDLDTGTLTGNVNVSSDTFTTSTAQKQAIVDGGGTSEAKGLAPVGSIFQMSFTPGSTWLSTNRFLICDGSSLNSTTDTQYADLYTAIGTTWGGSSASAFNIPDLKGAYLRGVGTSTVFTQDQTITLAQTINDTFQGHYHNFANYAYFSNENYNEVHTGRGASPLRSDSNAGGVTGPKTDGSNGTPRTGNETRPNSRGVQFIIKY